MEVVGDSTETFEPDDIGAVAESLRQIVDPAQWLERSARVRERAATLSWETFLAQHVAAYRSFD